MMRNIPACAGKTFRNPVKLDHNEEHPRVRGENPIECRDLDISGGTSPRARGKR